MRKKNYLILLLILIMMVSLVSSISLIVSAEEMNTEEINFNTASENLTYQGKNNFYMLTGDFSENQLYRMYYNTSYSVWQGYQNYTNWINTSNYNALMPYAGSDAALAYVVPNSGTMVLNGRIIESITGSGLIKASIIQRKNDGSADNIVYESLVTDNINEITLPNCEINVSVGDVIFFIAEENVTVSAWDAIIFDVSATLNKFIDGITHCAKHTQFPSRKLKQSMSDLN